MKTSALSELGRRTGPPPISWLMHLALSHPKLISLAAGFTDNESLPVAEVRASLDEILRSNRIGRPALQYGLAQGEPALRRLTAEHLRKLDREAAAESVAAKSLGEQMIITNGSQQLLYMVTEALCDPGDIVLVEDPTYFVYLGIVQSRGLRARGVRMENDGLDLAHLETILQSLRKSGELKRLKALYLVTCFQNPTGITTSLAKKAGALELLRRNERAAGHPIYLIEDAAYRELRFKGRDVPSALAIRGVADRVIYTGTYSKPFATGTRVGFGILPQALFKTVLHIKGNHDFGTSNLLQHMLVRALASGRYQEHLGELRKRYARKAETMRQAMQDHFPAAVERIEPEGGLYFWARLPRGMKSGLKSAVFQRALRHDVLYVPGALCYADDPTRARPDHELRVSFGSATERDIREGIKRLGAVLERILNRQSRERSRL
jgi:2-aminoadipate transaminase